MPSPILFLAFANNLDAHLPCLEQEQRDINEALRQLRDKQYIRVETSFSTRIEDVFNLFRQYQNEIEIFHFSGHASGYSLEMKGETAFSTGLASLLGNLPNLKLVFLNGCSTQRQVKQLWEAGVPAVIATKVSVSDIKAAEFANYFYQGLADGKNLREAYEHGVDFLKTKYKQITDGIYRDLYWESRDEQSALDAEMPWGLFLTEEGAGEWNLLLEETNKENWSKIISYTSTKCDSIQSQIGGKVKLERNSELTKFKEVISKSSFTFLLGQSGYGKSVLLKDFISELYSAETKAVWIDSDIIESKSLKEFFDLSCPFVEVIQQTQGQEGYIIIDSVERFRSEEHLRRLFNILNHIEQTTTYWKVVLSCQTDDLKDVIKRLRRINLSLSSNGEFELNVIEDSKLVRVQNEFPALGVLFKHEHLSKLLRNLKYLDLLASNLSLENQPKIDYSFGESDVIDLIWKEVVEPLHYNNGDQRSRLLQLISEYQAEKMISSVPKSKFDVAELAPLTSLKRGKILREVNDKLVFEHDLFSDWARYKLIRGNESEFKTYITSKNILSPLWGKAIRLYGVFLLEKTSSVNDWITTFSGLNENIPNEKIIQDLLLDSIIYSNSTLHFLDLLYDFFIQDSGKFLVRFLDRFLVKGTRPNSQVLQLAKTLGKYSEVDVATYQRVPIIPYWPPVIEFIRKNIDAFIPLSGDKIVDCAQKWLDFTPISFPYRKEASFCAFKYAEWIFNFKINDGYVIDGLDKKAYTAMLAGIDEMPDEILELCLKLCRRIKFEKPKKEKAKTDILRSKALAFRSGKTRQPTKWEHGPFERVDEAFAEVCLSNNGLFKLIVQYPEKAKEIILALLIEPPRPQSLRHDPLFYKYEITMQRGEHTPYYGRGPFLSFLTHHPYLGIDTIVNLVDFAVARWAEVEVNNSGQNSSIEIMFEEKKVFVGDASIYFWYRNSVNAPDAVASALMALERFLAKSIDAEENVEPYIQYILKHSNSVCFIGVLSFIGKYQPSLFFGILKPLLSCFELYRWEMRLDIGAYNIEGHQMMLLTDLDENTWNKVRDWNILKHRKVSLTAVGLQLYRKTTLLDTFYEKTILLWQEELVEVEKGGSIDVYKRNLIAQFNKQNYERIEHGDQVHQRYIEPNELEKQLAPLRDSDSRNREKFIAPFKYSKDIEDGKEYAKNEIDILWEEVFSESERPLSFDDYNYPTDRFSSLFAKIALLYEHQNLWIEENPGYVKWTINYTKQVLWTAPSKFHERHMLEGGRSYNSFIAKFLPKLWTRELKNKEIRISIALLCLKSTHKTIEALFRNITTELSWHHQDFIQLQNLVIQWSVGVYRFLRTHNKEDLPSVYEENIFQKLFNKVFNNKKWEGMSWIDIYGHKLLEDFVFDKTQKELISWSEERMTVTYVNQYSWRKDEDKVINRRLSGLDTQMLKYAFSSIPNLSETRNNLEYQYLLSLWNKVVEQLVFENGEITSDREVNSEYPRGFSEWALDGISRVILQMKEEDNPSRYWKPILAYGIFAPHQIDVFLQDFFTNNIGKENLRERFIEEWKLMVDFCTQCESWKKGKPWQIAKFEPSLYGASNYLMNIWDKDDSKCFLQQSSEKILTWFAENSTNYETIRRLILLLRKKHGEILLQKGLAILALFICYRAEILSEPAPQGYVHKEFEYNTDLGQTASHIWENHREVLANNIEVYNHFKQVIIYLVSINDPRGLELQSRIVEP